MSDSDSDEENVIRYGTPLEPFEEDEVPSKRKYQQQPDQYAVDAHGRRRFHGAFTGGFSAGYGNTVGTPEGWTPATFKSSRVEKAQISNQRAEDFMDEEDRGEFGIAPRHLQTRNEFSGQKRRHQRFHDGPIPGEPVLEQLVRAVHESAAVRMLRAMGWREGQGTGARLTRAHKKRAKEQHKVYGCYMPDDIRQNQQPQEEDSSDSEFEYETLFAPDDYEPYVLRRKSDRFGLGYSGLSRHSVLGNLTGEYGAEASTSHLVMKDKGKRVSIRGQAFGVGAFEADDDDIYATADMSHYDFAIGGKFEPQKTKKATEKTKNVVDGFVKATKPLPSVPSYPPPALPRDYVPLAAGARRSRFEPSAAPQRDQGLGRHEITAQARGEMLGEEPVPSTMPTQTNKPNEAIDKIPPKVIDFVTPPENQELDFISIKDSGKELVKVFKPFLSEPKKQARYEMYLKDKNSVLDRDSTSGDRVKEWERNRELIEFEQAAKLYRPLTGVMGDRFTHASEPDDALNPLCAVAKSVTNYGLASEVQIAAAKSGVYGKMTRRETQWRPESLVCKRFNVPELGVARNESKKEDKPKISYSVFSYLETSVHDKESFTKEQTKFSGSKSVLEPSRHETPKHTPIKAQETGPSKRLTVAELFLKESEKDLSEPTPVVADTIDKFDKMDLYKSIFLSDSEPEEVEKQPDKPTDYKEFIDTPKNIERNQSPPRGIFANIDFDELNSWKRNTDKKDAKIDKPIEPENKDGTDKVGITDKEEITEADVYGPKIPDNLIRSEVRSEVNFKPTFRKREERGSVHEIDSSSSSDSAWVSVEDIKSKKQKKKKKHKSKHKKSKRKKKER